MYADFSLFSLLYTVNFLLQSYLSLIVSTKDSLNCAAPLSVYVMGFSFKKLNTKEANCCFELIFISSLSLDFFHKLTEEKARSFLRLSETDVGENDSPKRYFFTSFSGKVKTLFFSIFISFLSFKK